MIKFRKSILKALKINKYSWQQQNKKKINSNNNNNKSNNNNNNNNNQSINQNL